MTLPVDRPTQEWLDARASWLVSQFGTAQLRAKQVVLPTTDFLPARFDATESDFTEVSNRVCEFMGLGTRDIEFRLYQEGGGTFHPTSLGRYEQLEDSYRIWIEVSMLREPLGLVAVLAHELGHIHLLGHGRLDVDVDDDHEPLTDLLTVFFGLGVICANAALHEEAWTDGPYGYWNLTRRGYLTMQSYGYALALFAKFRNEDQPRWRQHLRSDVRKYFDESMRYLGERRDLDLNRLKMTSSRPSLILPQANVADLQPDAALELDVTGPEGSCVYCGQAVSQSDNDICDVCQDSIEENWSEMQKEREENEARSLWYQGVGCRLIVLFVLGATIVAWLVFGE